jgi:hypothetical protein
VADVVSHTSPIDDCPKQPSSQDGLGTMCTWHSSANVKALCMAPKAAAGAGRDPL